MIHMVVPSIPISMNSAYVNQRGGKGRVLSQKGKKYKLATTSYLTRTYPEQLRYFRKDVPYQLLVHFVFKDEATLINKGYPEKARTRYKRLDVGNRLKLFEDALTDATGCDDSQHWVVTLSKATGSEDATHLWAWNLEDEPENPISNVLATLLCIAEIEQDGAVPTVP